MKRSMILVLTAVVFFSDQAAVADPASSTTSEKCAILASDSVMSARIVKANTTVPVVCSCFASKADSRPDPVKSQLQFALTEITEKMTSDGLSARDASTSLVQTYMTGSNQQAKVDFMVGFPAAQLILSEIIASHKRGNGCS